MAPASKDDRFLEGPQIRFGSWQHVLEPCHLLFKKCFGLVPFRRERVESVGESVVESSQTRDALGGNAA